MSTLTEVRHAHRARQRASEAHERAQQRFEDAVRAAADSGIRVPELAAETGLSQQRIHQIIRRTRTWAEKS